MILVEIAGFLGADPEERSTSGGKKVVSLRVATKVRQGGKDETVWWRVNIWGDRFEKMMPYLRKGTAVIILGEMSKPEIYVDKSGVHQMSLTLQADIIKFSPFGKPGSKNGESDSFESKPRVNSMASSHEEMSPFGSSLEPEHAFASDDLPF